MQKNYDITENSTSLGFKAKAKALFELTKFKLNMLVTVSAIFGYGMAASEQFSWANLCLIFLGGFLITGGANGLNQVAEREYDILMKRTQNRPMPTLRLTNAEAILFSLILGIAGVAVLGYFFNLPAALLGVIGYLSYAFVYTPMKRYSPFAVFIGAIPGALPPLIGWVAVTGKLDSMGLFLFAFQFFWQFPHFWAIAWLADEDYRKAGFKMMPSPSGKSTVSAALIMFYTICHVVLPLFPWANGMISPIQCLLLALLGVFYSIPSIQLYRTLDAKYARKLMFASFFYLPLMELIFILFN
jgi:protoheme IX farnesyltransferase